MPDFREHPRITELSEGLPSTDQVVQGIGDLTLVQYHVTTVWTAGPLQNVQMVCANTWSFQ